MFILVHVHVVFYHYLAMVAVCVCHIFYHPLIIHIICTLITNMSIDTYRLLIYTMSCVLYAQYYTCTYVSSMYIAHVIHMHIHVPTSGPYMCIYIGNVQIQYG